MARADLKGDAIIALSVYCAAIGTTPAGPPTRAKSRWRGRDGGCVGRAGAYTTGVTDGAAPRSLVAVRARREELIQLLSDSFANDLIDLDEFESRLSRAHAAETIAALDALAADLVPLPPSSPSVALAPLKIETALTAPTKRIRSLFGNVERRGAWVVPGALGVKATFGNVELDFRDARFSTPVTEIDARVLFGNLEIIVPPHLAVQCEGSSVFGNIESHGASAVADPDRPVLRILGSAVFGNIEVQARLPGESASDAHRRQKRALKAKG